MHDMQLNLGNILVGDQIYAIDNAIESDPQDRSEVLCHAIHGPGVRSIAQFISNRVAGGWNCPKGELILKTIQEGFDSALDEVSESSLDQLASRYAPATGDDRIIEILRSAKEELSRIRPRGPGALSDDH